MSKTARSENLVITVFLFLVAIAAGVGFYFWKTGAKTPAQPEFHSSPGPVPSISESPLPSPSPEIRYPVPEEKEGPTSREPKKALPPLDDSDQSLQERLTELFGKGTLDALVNITDLIRRVVVTVDNATGPHAAAVDVSVFIPAPGQFLVEGTENRLALNPKNYDRYKPYVSLIEKVNTKKLVDVYIHFYPLFQAAYHDLNPHGYFNDRLVATIDHLLEAPEMTEPIRLKQGVFYQFADPKLEACSSGQKALMRIGPENAKVIKAKLKQLRNALVLFGNDSR
ncbi:MAG: DUF3014 domain-containing protein [Oligoflexia bacterium]|nr:DUF3014 domain-containing protein [Oligoflexia bacterium]